MAHPAALEGWAAPAQSGARPWQVGGLVWCQQAGPNPPATEGSRALHYRAPLREGASRSNTGTFQSNPGILYSKHGTF